MKNFDDWNNEKKSLESSSQETLVFHEREIWWCSIGLNIGDEQDGKNSLYERPVLIIKKFNARIAWVVPLTSKQKSGPYYHKISQGETARTVILSQLRLSSTKRFRRLLHKISPAQMRSVRMALISLIG